MPEHILYPSCVCNLRVLLDESLRSDVDYTATEVPTSITAAIAVVTQTVTAFVRQLMPSFLSGTNTPMSTTMGIVPRKASINENGHRQADTFTLTLDFRDFPFDPRAVRSAMCEIHLGTIRAADFATGIVAQGGPATGKATAVRKSILQTRVNGALREDTLRIVGTVDDFEVTHGPEGSMVTLKGRGLEGMLLDAKTTSAVIDAVNLSQTIDRCVAQLLATHPLLAAQPAGIKVVARGWDTVPVLAAIGDVTRVRRGAAGKTAKSKGRGASQSKSYWDAITHWCTWVGAVPHFVGTILVIEPARNIWEQRASDTTPFKDGAPRKAADAQGILRDIKIPRIVYGRNIQSLTIKRKMGGHIRPVIEAVSTDTSSKTRGVGKVLTARWPAKTASPKPRSAGAATKASATRVAPSGGAAQKNVHRISVPGIRSKAMLQEIARQLYEEIGRQELQGSFSTTDCSTYGGDNADPDLLRLRPGSAIEIGVDRRALSSRAPVVAELIEQARRSEGAAVEFLVGRGIDRGAAAVLVRQTRGTEKLSSFFRMTSMRLTWDTDSGVAITGGFQNYVQVRADAESTAAAPTTMSVSTAGGA